MSPRKKLKNAEEVLNELFADADSGDDDIPESMELSDSESESDMSDAEEEVMIRDADRPDSQHADDNGMQDRNVGIGDLPVNSQDDDSFHDNNDEDSQQYDDTQDTNIGIGDLPMDPQDVDNHQGNQDTDDNDDSILPQRPQPVPSQQVQRPPRQAQSSRAQPPQPQPVPSQVQPPQRRAQPPRPQPVPPPRRAQPPRAQPLRAQPAPQQAQPQQAPRVRAPAPPQAPAPPIVQPAAQQAPRARAPRVRAPAPPQAPAPPIVQHAPRRVRPVPQQAQQAQPPQAPPPDLDDAYKQNLPWLPDYNDNPRPLLNMPDATPYELFKCILTDDAVDLLVLETNRYAEQYITSKGGKDNLSPSARARAWPDAGINELDMRAFLGILLYMGMIRLPTYEMYWANNELLQLGVKKVMSRDRFLNILSFFHCADNTQQLPRNNPRYDRLFKCREVTDICIAAWQLAYQIGREISADETVLGFSGTSSMVTYHPDKPHRFGITVWSLADPATGYVYNWNVYTGKRSTPDPRTLNKDGRGAVHWVTWDLVQSAGVLGKGHHLYMDNYFSSKTLYEDLALEGTGACGTLRRNRLGTPDVIKTANSSKTDPAVVAQSGKCTFFSWMDRNRVNLITTVHNEESFQKRTRSGKEATGWQVRDKPMAVECYTKHMRGVDLADQALWYSLNIHKTVKWWKKVVFGLLEVCFTNTLALYKLYHPDKRVNRNKFRLEIIAGLVEGYATRPHQVGPQNGPNLPPRRTGHHFPEVIPTGPGGKMKHRDCEVCSDRTKKRHTTQFQCCTCKAALCPAPCMMRYHTMPNDYRMSCAKQDGGKWVYDKTFHAAQ